MNDAITPLEQTFLDLIAIDEVHPNEKEVFSYVKRRLDTAGASYRQDTIGNIIALISGGAGEAVGIVAHTDIAAPLNDRRVVVEDNIIKTDGTGLLGGDDKAAVAAMLELADAVHSSEVKPAQPIELIFTVGEEAGCAGATAMDMSLISTKRALVMDWDGPVNAIITKSPAYMLIDVEFIGRTAHPAEWQEGRNAGAALIEAASKIQQGEYAPGITCNIGMMSFGQARNQIAGHATLRAELRSFDTDKMDVVGAEIKQLFEAAAAAHGIEAKLTFLRNSSAFKLNESGELFAKVKGSLAKFGLEPKLESTFGGFDANILAERDIEVIILGAAYYEPHSPSERVVRSEFAQVLTFLKAFVA